MARVKTKTICVDNDIVYVNFRYDESCQIWLGDYPYFDEEPRLTQSGRPWKNVFSTDCKYANSEYGDCGTCIHLKKENESDLIGVCFNDELRIDLK